MSSYSAAWLPWRRRLRDPLTEQLNDLERQGAGMAGLAHLAAFALVIVFSAGSLVALSGEALAALLVSAGRGALDVPAAISIAVSTLLVIAMDVALVYAAASVRLLRLRRAGGAGWHVAVIIGVSSVEAATYLYMSAVYDKPNSWAVWALVGARAVSAPLVAVYLSLARTLPVSARDIIASVELATGRGVVRDMTAIAADSTAPLERKLSLYSASSVMTPADSERLAALIATERATRTMVANDQTQVMDNARQAAEAATRLSASGAGGRSERMDSAEDRPPTGPGSPTMASKPAIRRDTAGGLGSNVTPITRRGMGRAPRRDKRTTARANARSGRRGAAEARIRAALAHEPGLAFDELVKAAGVSPSSASKWLAVIETERAAAQQAQ
jgi:hypothetical protein